MSAPSPVTEPNIEPEYERPDGVQYESLEDKVGTTSMPCTAHTAMSLNLYNSIDYHTKTRQCR